ncbi:MAG: TetR/AcrR family transcriptional regulator [Sneathiellaceae bacterium]
MDSGRPSSHDLDAGPEPLAPKRRRRQVERSAETRARLLDAAVEELVATGYVGLTVMGVAQRAGLTTGALQHQFGSKADLVLAVMLERLFPLAEMLPLPPQDGRSIAQRCRAIVAHRWRIFGNPAYPATWDIVLGARDDSDLRSRLEQFQKDTIRASLAQFETAFAGLGIGRARLDMLNHFLAAELRGLGLYARFAASPRYFTRQLAAVRQALEMMVQASLPDGAAGPADQRSKRKEAT